MELQNLKNWPWKEIFIQIRIFQKLASLVDSSSSTASSCRTSLLKVIADEDEKTMFSKGFYFWSPFMRGIGLMPKAHKDAFLKENSAIKVKQGRYEHSNMLMSAWSFWHSCKWIESPASGSRSSTYGAFAVSNGISLSDDELPPEGTGHNKALHIAVKCREMRVARVLIDNGSALNVCPLATISKLGVDRASIRPCSTTIRAFDGSKRQVQGEVDLHVEIGPHTFEITF